MTYNTKLYRYFIEDVEVTADDLARYLHQMEIVRLHGTPYEDKALDGYQLLEDAIDTFEECNTLGRFDFYADTIAGTKKYSIISRNTNFLDNVIRYGYISRGLTPKDKEIILMKINGYSDRQIADRFHISLNQASHLFNKALWKIKRNHQQLAKSLKEKPYVN